MLSMLLGRTAPVSDSQSENAPVLIAVTLSLSLSDFASVKSGSALSIFVIVPSPVITIGVLLSISHIYVRKVMRKYQI